MQLTLHTDYSLRILVYLAQKGGKQATISEIAEFYQVSRNHLVKVVHHLSTTGFLETIRGKHGGIKLSRPPDQIAIGDVVRNMEPNFEIVECFAEGNQNCVLTPVCKLKMVLNQASNEFLSLLDGHTIAEAITQNDEAEQIFSVEKLLNSRPSSN